MQVFVLISYICSLACSAESNCSFSNFSTFPRCKNAYFNFPRCCFCGLRPNVFDAECLRIQNSFLDEQSYKLCRKKFRNVVLSVGFQ